MKKEKSILQREITTIRSAQPEDVRKLTASLEDEKRASETLRARKNEIKSQYKIKIDEANERIRDYANSTRDLEDKIKLLEQEIEDLRGQRPVPKRRKKGDMETSQFSEYDLQDELEEIRNNAREMTRKHEQILKAVAEINAKLGTNAGTPKPANIAVQAASAPVQTNPKTYARILKDASKTSTHIRHINGLGATQADRIANLAIFKTSEEIKNTSFHSVRVKGPSSITVIFSTSKAAKAFEKLVEEKFAAIVESKGVTSRRPMVKIVRIPTETAEPELIKRELIRCNDWLKNASLDIEQVFEISIAGRTYMNCIIACDIEIQEQLTQMGTVSFGLDTCRVYEQIDVLQCNNCSRFGHIAINCVNETTCKKCAGSHKHTDCDAMEMKCVNCETANKSFGKDMKTDHNSAFDRCPMRIERINAIKNLLSSKN